jgi:outer membrane protein assembly factor BamB
MLAIVSLSLIGASFALEDWEGNKFSYPVPAWYWKGPTGGWYSATGSAECNYNHTGCSFNAFSTGPTTPHVAWVYDMYVGGTYGPAGGGKDLGFSDQGLFMFYGTGPIVCGGLLVYTMTPYSDAGTPGAFLVCLDAETGKHRWTLETDGYENMQFYSHHAQYDGGLVINLWDGVSLTVVDAYYGTVLQTWDFTKCKDWPGSLSSVNIMWEENVLYNRMSAVVYGFLYGIRSSRGREGAAYGFNITNPSRTADGSGLLKIWGPTPAVANMFPIQDGVAMCWYPTRPLMTGIDLKTGKILWENAVQGFTRGAGGYGNYYNKAGDGYVYCIDLKTGVTEWKSEIPAGTGYWTEHGSSIGNGVFIDGNYDGGIYCFDAFTGKLKWVRYNGATPYEPYASWYGTVPYGANPAVQSGDGLVYEQPGDHMTHRPAVPGQVLKCINVSTGEILWEYPAFEGSHTHRLVIQDGMLYGSSHYTSQMSAFGKGDTSIELSVPKSQIVKGEYTWITGKVLDQSPAQPGTPCVSKESMGGVMQALHLMKPMPADVTGVQLTLYAEDSAGTVTEIGTATTDGLTGMFRAMWTPPNEDLYKITAVFAGDESYWDSFAITTLAVGPAASVSSISSTTTATVSIASLAAVVIGTVVVQKRRSKNKIEETEQ